MRPELDPERQLVLLTLPSGEAWLFRAGGGTVDLEESVYFDPARRRRSRRMQVVVRAEVVEYLGQVTWSFGRIAERRPEPTAPGKRPCPSISCRSGAR